MEIIILLVVLIYSAILHEIAHGLVAEHLGDPTARLMGRITLNPIPHIDPYMSILLPTILYLSPAHIIIGGAKPVPVDPFNLRDGRKDMALVSLAGPATNFLIAIIFGLGCHFLFSGHSIDSIMKSSIVGFILGAVVYINILLGIFNLVPIPPLDGSKIFSLILPEKEAAVYLSIGNIGIFLLLFLFLFPIGGFSLSDILFNLLTFSEKLLGL